MIRYRGETGNFIHSKESVTQGDTLKIIVYVLGVLPLIRKIQEVHPNTTKPWYEDDAGSVGTFPHILDHLGNIMAWGTHQGYLPEPTKGILVVSVHNFGWSEIFFWGRGLAIVTGSRYMGGYVGDAEHQAEWLSEKVKEWVGGFRMMAGGACKHPQAAYVGLHKCLQQ